MMLKKKMKVLQMIAPIQVMIVLIQMKNLMKILMMNHMN